MDTSNSDAVWSVAAAKARLSEVLNEVEHGPQIITRHGKPVAVLVAPCYWERHKARDDNLAEFLTAGLGRADLDGARSRDTERDLPL